MARTRDLPNITQQFFFMFSAVRGLLWCLTVLRWQLFGWTVLKCDSTWMELQSFASAALLIFRLLLHLSNIHTSTSHPVTLSTLVHSGATLFWLCPHCIIAFWFLFALLTFLVIQWILQKEDLWQFLFFRSVSKNMGNGMSCELQRMCDTHLLQADSEVRQPSSDIFILFPHRHLSLALLSLSDRIVAKILRR